MVSVVSIVSVVHVVCLVSVGPVVPAVRYLRHYKADAPTLPYSGKTVFGYVPCKFACKTTPERVQAHITVRTITVYPDFQPSL